MAAKKKGKKPASAARVAAMAAVDAAEKNGSPAEKLAARTALKQIRFREIVVPRVNRTLKALDMLQKMGRASNYKWDAEQGLKIAKAIQAKAEAVHKVYTGAESKPEAFTL